MGNACVVACITDFGTSDYYAGALRGALAARIPGGSIVDVTHEISPGDIRRAAMTLWEAQPSFPKGTVFLTIVDPGVGTSRAASAIRFPDCTVVCPDNGVATFLMERHPPTGAVSLDPRRVSGQVLSNTFHGRDLFAPAAAQIALGTDLRKLGPALASPVRIPLPRFQGGPQEGWEGEVLYTDRFGNAVTSIGRISFDLDRLEPWLPTGARGGILSPEAGAVLEDGSRLPLRRTYADAKDEAERVALAGSNGLLEIAARRPGDGISLRAGTRVRLINSA